MIFWQCCGSGMLNPNPVLAFSFPGSYIKKEKQRTKPAFCVKIEEEKNTIIF
jgi:hypothetical protein